MFQHFSGFANRPTAFELHPVFLPWKQVGHQRPTEIGAAGERQQRRGPVRRAFLPRQIREALHLTQPLQLGRLRTLDAGIAHIGRRLRSRFGVANPDGDGDWGLNGEHVIGLPRAQIVAFQVNHPQVIERPAQQLAHSGKARPGQIRRGGDETDDARPALTLEHLPQRPAPEVDVIVVEILGVQSQAERVQRRDEIPQNPRPLPMRVAVANPAALAGLPHIPGVQYLPVIGWIAQTHQHRRVRLHFLCPPVFLAQRLVDQRQVPRRRGVGRLQGVGQINVRAVRRQRPAFRQHPLAQPQMRHRIRSHQNLERMEIARPDRRCLRPHSRPLGRRHPRQAMIQRGEDISAGAGGGVERDHFRINKGKLRVEAGFQQFGDQRHLRPHDRNRRVVDAAILAHLRVVDRQKIFVEIKPRIAARPLPRQRRRVHRPNHPFQHLDRRGDFRPRLLVGQDFQRLGQQAMLRAQGLGRLRRRQGCRARPAGQQQRIGQGLRVGIGELGVVGVGKQIMPPVHRQRRQTGFRILHRRQHFSPQQPAERGQRFRQSARRRRSGRLPEQEIPQQVKHRRRVVLLDRRRAVHGHIAGQPDQPPDPFAAPVQCPLIAIGIEQVRQVAELLPLRPILRLEFGRVRALARRFQFHIPGQERLGDDADIRSPGAFPILHLGQHLDRQPQRRRRPAQQGQHWRFQLIFGVEMQGHGELGGQLGSEDGQLGGERGGGRHGYAAGPVRS